ACPALLLIRCMSSTMLYTPSLHDALPISLGQTIFVECFDGTSSELICSSIKVVNTFLVNFLKRILQASCRLQPIPQLPFELARQDRKSTRLNSSHVKISYAVFCLKKKT